MLMVKKSRTCSAMIGCAGAQRRIHNGFDRSVVTDGAAGRHALTKILPFVATCLLDQLTGESQGKLCRSSGESTTVRVFVDGVVESADASESGRESNLGQRHVRLVFQTLCFLHPFRRCRLTRTRSGMAHEHTQQLARPRPTDSAAMAVLRAIRRWGATLACRRSRRALRPTLSSPFSTRLVAMRSKASGWGAQ